jgi:site-specific recombinase XerD
MTIDTVSGDALLPVVDTPALQPADLAAARRYAAASRAASTRRKYASAWGHFETWCRAQGQPALPAAPELVAIYLAREADRGLSPSAVNLALAAIGWMHRRAGRQPPQKTERGVVIADVMAGIRRSADRAPQRKTAADGDVLHDVFRAIEGDALPERRDRALLALGFAAALRRSELVALDRADLRRVPEGLRVTIRRSKTDQDGRGAEIAVPEGRRLRPVALVEAWLAAAGILEGAVFRRLSKDGTRVLATAMSDRAVARVVQRRVAAAGYDPAAFAGHSLRAGFLTSAARAGASVFKMREVSRHKTMQVLADYVRDARIFDDHAGKDFL